MSARYVFPGGVIAHPSQKAIHSPVPLANCLKRGVACFTMLIFGRHYKVNGIKNSQRTGDMQPTRANENCRDLKQGRKVHLGTYHKLCETAGEIRAIHKEDPQTERIEKVCHV
jgi:hypothetical protein